MFVSFRDRLCASDMIQVRKVMEHAYEKFVRGDAPTTNNSTNEKETNINETEDISTLAQSKIEIYCNEQVKKMRERGKIFIFRVYIYIYIYITSSKTYMSRVLNTEVERNSKTKGQTWVTSFEF